MKGHTLKIIERIVCCTLACSMLLSTGMLGLLSEISEVFASNIEVFPQYGSGATNALNVTPSSRTIEVGGYATFTAAFDGSIGSFSWRRTSGTSAYISSGASSSKVTIKGQSAGTSTFSVSRGGKTKSVTVTVKKPATAPTEEKAVNLDKTSATIKVGETVKVTASSSGGLTGSWSWSSGSGTAAKITNTSSSSSSTVTIKGEKEGTRTFTASRGGKSATVTITVTSQTGYVPELPGEEKVPTVSPKSLSIALGSSANVRVDNASSSDSYRWSANLGAGTNGGRVSVSSTYGTSISVYGLTKGTTNVYCYNGANKEVGHVSITVTDAPAGQAIPIRDISLAVSTITLKIGQSREVAASIRPDNATNKTLKWSTSNSSIAAVNQYGSIRGVNNGVCTVTCSDTTGTVKDYVTVKVGNGQLGNPYLSTTNITIEKGQDKTLSVNDLSGYAVANWYSQNSNVATVIGGSGSASCTVHGIEAGTTKVVCELTNGNKLQCNVTVKPTGTQPGEPDIPQQGKLLGTIVVRLGQKRNIPKSGTWVSSNSGVAEVRSNSQVFGNSVGTTIIVDGKTSDYYSVKCINPSLKASEFKVEEFNSISFSSIFNDYYGDDFSITPKSSGYFTSDSKMIVAKEIGPNETKKIKEQGRNYVQITCTGNFCGNSIGTFILKIYKAGTINEEEKVVPKSWSINTLPKMTAVDEGIDEDLLTGNEITSLDIYEYISTNPKNADIGDVSVKIKSGANYISLSGTTVTALDKGKATIEITNTTYTGLKKLTATVEVKSHVEDGVAMVGSYAALVGTTLSFSDLKTYGDASKFYIKSNTSYVSNNGGSITLKKPTTSGIVVNVYKNGSNTAITGPNSSTKLSIYELKASKKSVTYDASKSETLNLLDLVTPKQSTLNGQTYSFTSSDTKVGVIEGTNLVPKGNGTTTITVKAPGTSASVSFDVTVSGYFGGNVNRDTYYGRIGSKITLPNHGETKWDFNSTQVSVTSAGVATLKKQGTFVVKGKIGNNVVSEYTINSYPATPNTGIEKKQGDWVYGYEMISILQDGEIPASEKAKYTFTTSHTRQLSISGQNVKVLDDAYIADANKQYVVAEVNVLYGGSSIGKSTIKIFRKEAVEDKTPKSWSINTLPKMTAVDEGIDEDLLTGNEIASLDVREYISLNPRNADFGNISVQVKSGANVISVAGTTITALDEGKATIEITNTTYTELRKLTATVEVKSHAEYGVMLVGSYAALVGTTLSFSDLATHGDASKFYIKSNTSYVSNNGGSITLKKPTTSGVIVNVYKNGTTKAITGTATKLSIYELKASKKSVTYDASKSETLNLLDLVTPKQSTLSGQSYSFTSSDTKVGVVEGTNLVPKGNGTTTITVRASGTSASVTFDVTVNGYFGGTVNRDTYYGRVGSKITLPNHGETKWDFNSTQVSVTSAGVATLKKQGTLVVKGKIGNNVVSEYTINSYPATPNTGIEKKQGDWVYGYEMLSILQDGEIPASEKAKYTFTTSHTRQLSINGQNVKVLDDAYIADANKQYVVAEVNVLYGGTSIGKSTIKIFRKEAPQEEKITFNQSSYTMDILPDEYNYLDLPYTSTCGKDVIYEWHVSSGKNEYEMFGNKLSAAGGVSETVTVTVVAYRGKTEVARASCKVTTVAYEDKPIVFMADGQEFKVGTTLNIKEVVSGKEAGDWVFYSVRNENYIKLQGTTSIKFLKVTKSSMSQFTIRNTKTKQTHAILVWITE